MTINAKGGCAPPSLLPYILNQKQMKIQTLVALQNCNTRTYYRHCKNGLGRSKPDVLDVDADRRVLGSDLALAADENGNHRPAGPHAAAEERHGTAAENTRKSQVAERETLERRDERIADIQRQDSEKGQLRGHD